MPNRQLKESICTSESLAVVSAEAERLFYRIIVNADDYGRYHGNTKVILAECFPLRIGDFTPKDIEAWLLELERVGMIRRYATDKRRFLCVVSWREHNTPRAKASKYPSPDDCTGTNLQTSANICKQTHENALEVDNEVDNEVLCPIPEESDNTHDTIAAVVRGEVWRSIFDHWNEKEIIKHRSLTDKLKRAINGALANCSRDEIVQAVDNYSRVLQSPDHYFKYRWTLNDFLQRGLDKFMLEEVCMENYRKDHGGGNGHGRQGNRVYGQPGNQPSGAFDDVG